jgi:hypothetical protein
MVSVVLSRQLSTEFIEAVFAERLSAYCFAFARGVQTSTAWPRRRRGPRCAGVACFSCDPIKTSHNVRVAVPRFRHVSIHHAFRAIQSFF